MKTEHTFSETLTRRGFLHLSAVCAAGSAAASIPGTALRRPAPSETLLLGFAGMGATGREHFNRLLALPGVRPVAVADPDALRRVDAVEFALTRRHTVAGYADFREMLREHPELDAVFVATPDHWHAPAALACLRAGVDVHCERPLGRGPAESRAVLAEARRLGRVVQAGAPWRMTHPAYRQACEWARTGRIGVVERAVCCFGANPRAARVPEEAAPAHLDWNLYLGDAPWRPYNRLVHPYNFRYYRDLSGGSMSEWGAQLMDAALYGMNRAQSGPRRVETEAAFWAENFYEFPREARAHLEFEGARVECYQNAEAKLFGRFEAGESFGVKFYGSEGEVFANAGRCVMRGRRNRVHTEAAPLPAGDCVSRYAGFLEDVRNRRLDEAGLESAHRSVSAAHLGNLSIALGRALDFDPVREDCPHDAGARAWLAARHPAHPRA